MRFLADENFPLRGVEILTTAGHDVAAIIRESPDEQVLLRAVREDSVLPTFDRDHGRLLYGSDAPVPGGVVYFRFVPDHPEEPAEYLLAILEQPEPRILGMLTIVERDRIRRRRLPEAN